MSITNKKEQILAYIKATALALINGAGNFNYTTGQISRKMLEYTKLEMEDDKIYLSVTAQNTTRYSIVHNDNSMTVGNPTDIDSGFMVTIVGFMNIYNDPGDEGLVQQALVKMESDIVLAMTKTLDMGGLCYYVFPVESSPLVDYENNKCMIFVTFAIKYDFNLQSSTPTW